VSKLKSFVLLAVLAISFSSSQASEEVLVEPIEGDISLTQSRPWRAPDYSNQESALGWSEDAFKIPEGLEIPVQFWINVYSKYTSDQGILHDSENLDLIYKEIDFSDIMKRGDINIFRKEVLKENRVKKERQRIEAVLKKLHKIKNPDSLNEEERKIWDYFSNVREKNKFLEAAKKSRVRFQLGQKDRVIQGIFFSGRYLEDFEKIFTEAGLPRELTRMVFVESSFNIMARSRVGASGLWQIMPVTYKQYHKKNLAVDLRNHPLEATKMAAKILRSNYRMLKSWPLATTGYNHGPTGVSRVTKRYKTRDIGELVKNVQSRRSWGFASRNFYASFLAILEVERNAPKYLGPVLWSQKLEEHLLQLPMSIEYKDLLRWFDGEERVLQVYNPHLNREVRLGKMNLPKGTLISVPAARWSQIELELKSKTSLEKARQAGQEGN
jgi:membrane-bound lytic murein transglycosylase D